MMRMIPTIPAGFILSILQRPAALDEIDDEHDDRDHQQDVNESSERVRADESEQPEHEENDEDSPEHSGPFRVEVLGRFVSCREIARMSIEKFFTNPSGCIKTRQSADALFQD